MKQNMYYGASHLIFQKAEELRNRMTPAEEIVWKHIHINEWRLKFRRQHPIWNYVADFYCHSLKFVIELDGEIHETEGVKINDEQRQKHLKELGLTVLKLKNEDVFKNIDSVIKQISQTVEKLRNTPSGDGGKSLFVIKIGGNIIDDETKLLSFLKQYASVPGNKILIHGGGKLATGMAEKLGIPQQMIEGRRITNAETLRIVTMVYAGLINKQIVATLQSNNCNAAGICGADGNAIKAHKRINANTDYGFAGDVDNINSNLLNALLNLNLSVVIAPITHDKEGQLLNTNADTIAQEIAREMAKLYKVNLIFTFEKNGVLKDINDDTSVISELTWASYKQLKKENKIFDGMIPKLENAFSALEKGVNKVIIGKAENLTALIEGKSGTTIIYE
jgi:acetylglutamate kinase